MANSKRLSSPVEGYQYGQFSTRDDDSGYTPGLSTTSTSNRNSFNQIEEINDPRSSLQRRFTTNSSANAGGLGPIGSPSRSSAHDSANGHAVMVSHSVHCRRWSSNVFKCSHVRSAASCANAYLL